MCSKLQNFRVKFKTELTIEQIEQELKALRDEWDRELPEFTSKKMRSSLSSDSQLTIDKKRVIDFRIF